ncbi:MAG: LCP family protein [Arachnia sp.]
MSDREPPRPRRASLDDTPPELTEIYRSGGHRSARHADPADGSRGPLVEELKPRAAKPRTLRRSLALTTASAVLPGSGLLAAPKRVHRTLGAMVVTLVLTLTIATVIWANMALSDLAGIAVNPRQLTILSAGVVAVALGWVALITGTHLVTRPGGMTAGRRAVGALLVTALSFVVSAPLAVAARYAYDQRELLETVFADEDDVNSGSRPTLDDGNDPWASIPRLNILILGGDSSDERTDLYGVRTDAIMVASVDTATGETVLIQLPRNLQYTPFPEGSELDEAFPSGFTGDGDAANWYLNAVWPMIEGDYPSLLEEQTYRGAEALKLGVEGITGLHMDYFVLVNMDGIQELIDAMGGVTVNINQRLPIGGDTTGRQPSGYLEIGPDQRLNGYEAMWYGRSRKDDPNGDYGRMARQSCLVDAIIQQANPATLLTSYEAIAAASADMIMTDIPQQVLDPLLTLALRIKDASISRVLFVDGQNGYSYAYPDFDTMHETVADAIETSQEPDTPPTSTPQETPAESTPEESATDQPPAEEPSSEPSPSHEIFVDGAQSVNDACAYHPVESDDE